MAVFPDRIVLKNSTDDQATIEAAIATGGTDEITQGEIVLGLETSSVTFYTKASDGSIVTFNPTSAAGRAIVSDTAPTVGINGLPLADGDLWFESDSDSYYVYYLSAWVQVSSGSGGSLGDLTDVDLLTPPTNGQVIAYNSTSGNWEPVDQTGGGGLSNIVEDTTPQLGGNLDVNSFYISSASGGDIEIAPDTTGDFIVRGNNTDASIILNCTANTHGVKIQSPPHADAATYTLILPSSAGTAGQVLTSQGGAQLTWEDASSGGLPAVPSGGEVLASDGAEWTALSLPLLLEGGSFAAADIQLDFEGSGDTPTLITSGMTSTYPSTDAKFGSGGATFLRSNQDSLQGTWSQAIGTQAFTLSFWVKTTDTDYSVTTGRRIIAPVSGTNLSDGFQLFRDSAGGTTYTPHADNAQGAIALSPAGTAGSYLCSTRTNDVADGAWHYIVIQHEGGGVYSCFFDGNLTERRTAASAIDFGDNGGFFLGRRQDTNANAFFTGSIDNLVLEIGSVLSSGSTVPVPTAPRGVTVDYGAGASIDNLTDVDTSTAAPSDGQVLTWVDANSQWEPVDAAGGGTDITTESIDALSDVDTSTVAPTDGQVLSWVDANNQWEPADASVPGNISYGMVMTKVADGDAVPASGEMSLYINNTFGFSTTDNRGIDFQTELYAASDADVKVYYQGIIVYDGTTSSWGNKNSSRITITFGDVSWWAAIPEGASVEVWFDGVTEGKTIATNPGDFVLADRYGTARVQSAPDIDALANVDTSGALDGDFLMFSGASGKWVDTTPQIYQNSNVGKALSPYAEYTFTPGAGTNPTAGQIDNYLTTNWTAATEDLNGTDFQDVIYAISPGSSFPVEVLVNDVSTYVGTIESFSNFNFNRYTFQFGDDTWKSGLVGGDVIKLVASPYQASEVSEADGQVLTWNATRSSYEPATPAVTSTATARTLLGIGEYADDAAAGTGGVASGALYYNTTSSDYRLKT